MDNEPDVDFDLLTDAEAEAIWAYWDFNDDTLLDGALFQEGATQEFKRFYAGLCKGEITRPPRAKASTFHRDAEIHHKIKELLDKNPNLTLNTKKKVDGGGAAAIVAKEFKHVSEDAALKAYQRMNRYYEEASDAIMDELDKDIIF